ncbi:putative ubiquitin thioesterase otu1 [Lachnellula cervina]|uniref:Ubiquitin thioesterase OTU n=1 Tax=Lachnellula cervina TaxID=1316786 RepID=A0A7D8YXR4_9HELO|nr:putative ubiquitin thioesterase otu1 [Lachnellula cervina]
MRTRLRGPGGTSTLTLPDDATVGDLLTLITEKTSVAKFDIKYGYPPQPLLLEQYENSQALSQLGVKLDGEQLIISPKDDPSSKPVSQPVAAETANKEQEKSRKLPVESSNFSFTNVPGFEQPEKKQKKPVALQRAKTMEGDVPELPLPERGATLVLRVMPDDNSCLFRAFGTAVLPGDDKSMPELRSLVASAIQASPDIYTKVVLEQSPDEYCRWIQTPDAWGGAIEMGILSKHFEVEICSIDVQSLRIDKFNEGASTRCILVYSGIHYDTIVQSPSEPPHTKANNPPDFDKRIWDDDDDEILILAQELCKKLQDRHYYTDTGGMAIKCGVCGVVVYGEGQAGGHATQTGHYDMAEVVT